MTVPRKFNFDDLLARARACVDWLARAGFVIRRAPGGGWMGARRASARRGDWTPVSESRVMAAIADFLGEGVEASEVEATLDALRRVLRPFSHSWWPRSQPHKTVRAVGNRIEFGSRFRPRDITLLGETWGEKDGYSVLGITESGCGQYYANLDPYDVVLAGLTQALTNWLTTGQPLQIKVVHHVSEMWQLTLAREGRGYRVEASYGGAPPLHHRYGRYGAALSALGRALDRLIIIADGTRIEIKLGEVVL